MKDTTEILDLLEKVCVDAVCAAISQLYPITKDGARNLVGKVGTRIVFSGSMTKEELDKILTHA